VTVKVVQVWSGLSTKPRAADCEDELRFDGAHEHLKSFFRSEIERSELVPE